MRHLAGGVRPCPGGPAVPHQHFVDVGRPEPGARQRRPHGHRAKLGHVHRRQRAAKASDGRARRAQDDDIAGRHQTG
jgi:hypothetical protein